MTSALAAVLDAPIRFPDGVDPRPHLRGLRHSAWAEQCWTAGGAHYRRTVTADSPVRFALTYFSRYLRNHDGVISFSPAHLDMAGAATRWAQPVERRVGWVLPRDAGKSVWLYLILPAWAIAHGHRRSFLSFSATAAQAEGHLANLRAELAENELLLADFPDLAPARGAGRSNTAGKVTLRNGATIMARGLTASSLGTRVGTVRPDLIIGDDLEPDEARHTPERKAEIESRLINSILPMGGRGAVVHVAGTTTMVGSLTHDVVRAALPRDDRDHRVAPWIRAHRFVPCYWPALLDEHTDRERSMWPWRWTTSELQDMRELDPQGFSLNYRNRPETAGARGWWTAQLITYNRHRDIARRVLSVDGAMSNNRRNDLTAIVVVGVDASGHRLVVDYAAAGRWHGAELLDRCRRLTEAYPDTLHEWVVETQHGGDRWETDILTPRPPGVRFVRATGVSGVHKRVRIEDLLGHYQRRAIEHREPLQTLEDQQLAWTPAADKDDLLDALANGVRHLLKR